MNRASKRKSTVEQADQLLKDVHKQVRNAVIKRGFRILKAVSLQNCANDEFTEEANVSKEHDGNIDRICENKRQTSVERVADDQSCEPCINNEISSMEIVTGDDSIQYVINYITDDEISSEAEPDQESSKYKNKTVFKEIKDDNGSPEWSMKDSISILANSDTILKEELIIDDELVSTTVNENDRMDFNRFAIDANEAVAKTEDPHVGSIKSKTESVDNHLLSPLYKEFTFKEAYLSLAEAINKMRQESDHWGSMCVRQIGNQIRHFQCNYKMEHVNCPVRVLVVKREICGETQYLYYDVGLHVHDAPLTMDKTTKIPPESNKDTEEIIISDDESDRNSAIADDTENQEYWTFERKFNDFTEANEYIKNLNLLSFDSQVTKGGIKEFYKCKLVVGNVQHCPASRYLQYKNRNDDIFMFNRGIRHVDICPNRIPPSNTVDTTETDSLIVIELIESDEEPNESHSDGNTSSSQQDYSSDTNSMRGWILEKEFTTTRLAKDFLREQHVWSYANYNKLDTGLMTFYRCNLPHCPAAKLIHITNSSKVVSVYKSTREHIHDAFARPDTALDAFEVLDGATKNQIEDFFLSGKEPHEILKCLNLHVYDASFQNELLHSIRKMYQDKLRKNLTSAAVIKTVQDWLPQLSAIPTNCDSCFCVSFYVDYATEKFQCFLSTRRLLQNALDANSVYMDSSILLEWETNYITFIGSTDLDGKFHVFGLAICSTKQLSDYEFMFKAIQKGVKECHKRLFKPAYLIADDNSNVHNAFLNIFGKSRKIGVCPKLALSKIIRSLSASNCPDLMKTEIRQDIQKIFKLPSRPVFLKAVGLFFRKWRPLGGSQMNNFFTYFSTPWVNRISNWFEIFPQFIRNVNKGIQSEYDSLRKSIGRKRNRPIDQFLCDIKIEVENMSRARANDILFMVPTRRPKIPRSLYVEAIQWKHLIQQYSVVHDFRERRYYFPAVDDIESICEEKLKKYRECDHETLDELLDIQFSFWCLVQSKQKKYTYCSCPQFLENYNCKHSVVGKFR